MSEYILTIKLDSNIVESTVNGKVYQMDLDEMSNAGRVYILKYGAQRGVNDRCGGSNVTAEEKDRLAKARIDKIMSGDFTARERGNPADEYADIRQWLDGKLSKAMAQRGLKPINKATRAAFFEAQPEATRDAFVRAATAERDSDLALYGEVEFNSMPEADSDTDSDA